MIQLPIGGKKLFVLDTNVILHDGECFLNFDEHDVVIPMVVLEELDKFKKGNENRNLQARRFLRKVDEYSDDVLHEDGMNLGGDSGRLRIVLTDQLNKKLGRAFLQDCPDHRILNTALLLQHNHPDRKVILITKDTNLRLKARGLNIVAQDYTTDKVDDVKQLYRGTRILETDPQTIDEFYANGGTIEPDRLPLPEDATLLANEFFVLRNGSKSTLATFNEGVQALCRVDRPTAYGVQPKNVEQTFALQALLDDSIKLVTLVGKAGTGKTLLALAAALEKNASYQQVLMGRPIVPLSNRDLGFLPGDIDAKMDPYMQPLYDNLKVIQNQFGTTDPRQINIRSMLENEKLMITPLSYIRGRSLQNVFFIVDEAQNLTPHEMKTIITRAGEGTKIVLTGDIHQIDHPYLDTESNGLSFLISRMKGQGIYAHVMLEKGERSVLADLASKVL
jgi:PhoH-like ATPase